MICHACIGTKSVTKGGKKKDKGKSLNLEMSSRSCQLEVLIKIPGISFCAPTFLTTQKNTSRQYIKTSCPHPQKKSRSPSPKCKATPKPKRYRSLLQQRLYITSRFFFPFAWGHQLMRSDTWLILTFGAFSLAECRGRGRRAGPRRQGPEAAPQEGPQGPSPPAVRL